MNLLFCNFLSVLLTSNAVNEVFSVIGPYDASVHNLPSGSVQ